MVTTYKFSNTFETLSNSLILAAYKLSNTFETGLDDHQKLISTVAKSGSFKGRPRDKFAEAIDLLTLKLLKNVK